MSKQKLSNPVSEQVNFESKQQLKSEMIYTEYLFVTLLLEPTLKTCL